MPRCSECRMLRDGQCAAYPIARQALGRVLPPPPLGACMIPIVEGYCASIRAGMRVLDIGCGSWTALRDHCRAVGAHYEAIDTTAEYMGEPTVATRVENLAALSFDDNAFDLVIGNQTMEHWAENGCALRWGLYQCFRVCKPGGRVCLNVPIHYHGTRPFLDGELDAIKRLFAPFSWQVTFERWGYPSAPLPEVFPRAGYRALRNRPAHVLDIHAVKDRPLPHHDRNRAPTIGLVAELVNYPPSFTLYRLLVKAGLARRS